MHIPSLIKKHALPIGLSHLEITLKLLTIWKVECSEAVVLAPTKTSLIPLARRPIKYAIAIHQIFVPLAVVGFTIAPPVNAGTLHFTFHVVSGVRVAICIFVAAEAVQNASLETTFVAVAAWVSDQAFAVLFVVKPGAFVLLPVLVPVHAVTVSLTFLILPFVQIAV